MTTIHLHQPGLIDQSIDFPTEWNELSVDDLHMISKAMLSAFSEANDLRAVILHDMMQRRCKLPGNLNAEDVVLQGYPLLDFVFKENNLTKQPYDRIKLPGLALSPVYGPQGAFDNLTCGEFEDAEIFYHQFVAEPDPEPLARLASVLWRPKKRPYLRYNRRTGQYVPYDAERRLKHFRKLSPWILYTIFTWYTGCRNQLPKLFPTAFEGEGPTSDEPDFLAFTKCIHSGAGPKNGTRDQIRMMLLKEYFLDMELEAVKVKELKAQS